MTDESDSETSEVRSSPSPLSFVQEIPLLEINARAQLEAIRIELSKVNTTAIRTPEAFVSWLRSKL